MRLLSLCQGEESHGMQRHDLCCSEIFENTQAITRAYQGVLYASLAIPTFFFRWFKEKSNLETVTVFDYGVPKMTHALGRVEECSSFREQKDEGPPRVSLGYRTPGVPCPS